MKMLLVTICTILMLGVGNAQHKKASIKSQQWEYVNNGMVGRYTYDITFSDIYIFAATDSGVFRSSNQGGEWQQVSKDVTIRLETIGRTVYALGSSNMTRTTNNGESWSLVMYGNVKGVAAINNVLFAVKYPSGVLRSMDNGATWTAANGNMTNMSIDAITVQGTEVFVGTFGGVDGGIFKSKDYGSTWYKTGITAEYTRELYATGAYIYAVIDGQGIMRSWNGINWEPKNEGMHPYPLTIGGYGSTLYVGTYTNTPAGNTGGAYMSKNDGNTWTKLTTDGLTFLDVYGIGTDGGYYIFIANLDGGVARYYDDTAVDDPIPQIHTTIQNFPNPFSLTTTIEYAVEHSGQIQLKVIDILGREIVLVDEVQSVGLYRRVWNAPSSGTYFATLEYAGQRNVVRMSAIK